MQPGIPIRLSLSTSFVKCSTENNKEDLLFLKLQLSLRHLGNKFFHLNLFKQITPLLSMRHLLFLRFRFPPKHRLLLQFSLNQLMLKMEMELIYSMNKFQYVIQPECQLIIANSCLNPKRRFNKLLINLHIKRYCSFFIFTILYMKTDNYTLSFGKIGNQIVSFDKEFNTIKGAKITFRS